MAIEHPYVSSSTAAATENVAPAVDHLHRRFFIGPMPEKELDTKKKKRGQIGSENEDDGVTRLIRHHAFSFFLQHGGKPEDWDDDQETHVVREMLSRWHHTEWAQILSRKKKEPGQSRWVGGTFEIGNLLGLNLLNEPTDSLSRVSARSTRSKPVVSSVQLPSHDGASSVAAETFVTAPSTPPALKKLGLLSTTEQASTSSVQTTKISPSENGKTSPPSPSSSTPLLRGSVSQQLIRRPMIEIPSFSSEPPFNNFKGKQRLVHYAASPIRSPRLSPLPSSRPISPIQVLEREGEDVRATSAGAMVSAVDTTEPERDEVILRDRMYVRNYKTKDDFITKKFDEVQHRTTRKLGLEDQGEFMVVWRKNQIELYRDYSLPGKEWLMGHKDLAHVISLKSDVPLQTKLSLYSFVDATFCLIASPKPFTKIPHFLRDDETNVFIFKHKCRSRAFDWLWRMWRHLGGQLPSMVEVWNPSLGSKVKIDVPGFDPDEQYRLFTRDNVIALCLQSLRSVGDYKYLIEKQLAEGKVLALAWRVDTFLDWIWRENDVFGDPRESAVLCGLAINNGPPPRLEIRLGQHFPNHVRFRDGTRIDEPPAMEGYVDRIKPNSQAKQQLYIATHDGNLFIMSPACAFPPKPFGVQIQKQSLEDEEEAENLGQTLRQFEVLRGASQIMNATHFTDLRNIVAVRRAFQLAVPRSHDVKARPSHQHVNDSESWLNVNAWAEEEASASDDEDDGGDEAMGKTTDKARLRIKRSFELLLKDGHIVRFEVYSRRIALEWIQKLQALIPYWIHRHRVDAREEMDAAQARRPRITPQQHVHQADEIPEAPADPSAPLPALASLFNWCVLEGCKPIVRGGKVYTRKGLHGQYQMVQMFLISGYLVHFSINPQSQMHRSMNRVISLRDAYVCSGYFAAQTLPYGQYNANAPSAPRRYQDGLETDDPEEDILFIVWYRPHTTPSSLMGADASQLDALPSLSTKKKILVYRTRSKLERDAWCWALNTEIEKLARSNKEREIKLRDTGQLTIMDTA